MALASLPLGEILEQIGFDLQLELVAGASGLSRSVSHPRAQRPGLALAGQPGGLGAGRLQVLGPEELGFLGSLPAADRLERLGALLAAGPAGVVVAGGSAPPEGLTEEAERRGVPLLVSSLPADQFEDRLAEALEEQLGPSRSMHGVLVDVMGVGVMILGKSGIGKSECALDLVMRGHRLVADDVIIVRRRGGNQVFGSCSPLLMHHMEIRGLGIINIKDLYGVSAVRERKKIELVVELTEWRAEEEYDRLGLDDRSYDLLGVPTPHLIIPVRPGRYTTSLVEVAARNLLLKRQGHHSAREFQARLHQAIAEAAEEGDGGEVVE
ncbi:MAG TPA: HPr(Ser) kinase/phosphatase [Myxococcota bacterium]|nr:HPr(Ser) kinase/phosphatase [Myxococcota bacterium]HRY95319.1 HPr(Ser) kinase/phosphatase [Myxococcota bacterium]HSA20773.1 HPr(Ser) kinase/phosphatase [Myxococcota bacterium]